MGDRFYMLFVCVGACVCLFAWSDIQVHCPSTLFQHCENEPIVILQYISIIILFISPVQGNSAGSSVIVP